MKASYVSAEKVLPKELYEEVKKYATGILYIPKGRDAETKKQLVLSLHKHNTPAKEIAILAGLSVRRVHQIIAREHLERKRTEPFSTLDAWLRDTNTPKELKDAVKAP